MDYDNTETCKKGCLEEPRDKKWHSYRGTGLIENRSEISFVLRQSLDTKSYAIVKRCNFCTLIKVLEEFPSDSLDIAIEIFILFIKGFDLRVGNQ